MPHPGSSLTAVTPFSRATIYFRWTLRNYAGWYTNSRPTARREHAPELQSVCGPLQRAGRDFGLARPLLRPAVLVATLEVQPPIEGHPAHAVTRPRVLVAALQAQPKGVEAISRWSRKHDAPNPVASPLGKRRSSSPLSRPSPMASRTTSQHGLLNLVSSMLLT